MATHAGPWGAGDRFPQTRRSVLLAARDADPAVRRQAWEALAGGYWKPVYKLLRTRWRHGRRRDRRLRHAAARRKAVRRQARFLKGNDHDEKDFASPRAARPDPHRRRLDLDKGSFMHGGKIAFAPDGGIVSEWDVYAAGKPAGAHTFHLSRVGK